MTDFAPFVNGDRIAQYRVIKLLAKTQSSELYLVDDKHLQKPVVLKLLSAKIMDEQTRLRFVQQANIVLALPDPKGVVGLMHIGELDPLAVTQEGGDKHETGTQSANNCRNNKDGKRPFIVMPYYPQTLHKLLALHQQSLSFSTSLGLITSLLSTLQKLHALNILHLDIKPQNIYLNENSEPFLGDFDNAWVLSTSPIFQIAANIPHDITSQVRLTLAYASPEQHHKQVFGEPNTVLSAQSDLFSLGMLWYRILLGETPVVLSQKISCGALDSCVQADIDSAIIDKLNRTAPNWAIQLLLSMLQISPLLRPNSAQECLRIIESKHDLADDDQTITVDTADISPRLRQLQNEIEYILRQEGKVSADHMHRLSTTYIPQDAQCSIDSQVNYKLRGENNNALLSLISDIQLRLTQQDLLGNWFAWVNSLRDLSNKETNQQPKKTSHGLIAVSVQKYTQLLQAGRDTRPDHPELAEAVLAKYFLRQNIRFQRWKTLCLPFVIIVVVFAYLWLSPLWHAKVSSTQAGKASNPSPLAPTVIPNNAQTSTGEHTNIPTETAAVLTLPDDKKGYYSIDYQQSKKGKLLAQRLLVPWVRIDPLVNVKIMATEVTNELYSLCEQEGACQRTTQYSTTIKAKNKPSSQHPKVNVSWHEIQHQFIPWLNAKLNSKFSLPNLAQWQQIVRTTILRINAKQLINMQHCKNCSSQFSATYAGMTMPVLLLPPLNNFYHVFGNAQEWLADCWHPEFENMTIDFAPLTRPLSTSLMRCDQAIVAGGSWIDKKERWHNMPISQLLKTARTPTTGFRLIEYLHDY